MFRLLQFYYSYQYVLIACTMVESHHSLTFLKFVQKKIAIYVGLAPTKHVAGKKNKWKNSDAWYTALRAVHPLQSPHNKGTHNYFNWVSPSTCEGTVQTYFSMKKSCRNGNGTDAPLPPPSRSALKAWEGQSSSLLQPHLMFYRIIWNLG